MFLLHDQAIIRLTSTKYKILKVQSWPYIVPIKMDVGYYDMCALFTALCIYLLCKLLKLQMV